MFNSAIVIKALHLVYHATIISSEKRKLLHIAAFSIDHLKAELLIDRPKVHRTADGYCETRYPQTDVCAKKVFETDESAKNTLPTHHDPPLTAFTFIERNTNLAKSGDSTMPFRDNEPKYWSELILRIFDSSDVDIPPNEFEIKVSAIDI